MNLNKSIALFAFILALYSCGTKTEPEPAKNEENISKGSPENAVPSTPSLEVFQAAALDGNMQMIQGIGALNIPVDTVSETKTTLLMMASFNGKIDVIKYLVGLGADVNLKDANGRTAVIYASSGPFPGTVDFLLENGAEIDVKDDVEGFTALMFAAVEGQLDVVKVLIERGADHKILDKDGESALDFARGKGHLSVVEYLSNLR